MSSNVTIAATWLRSAAPSATPSAAVERLH
jgi:hypothetical protein